MLESVTNFDFRILDWIQENLRCAFLDAVMPWITHLAKAGILFIILAVLMVFSAKWRKTGWSIGIALILGLIVCNLILKPLVARIRPYDVRDFALLIAREKDWSFPSGHTIAAFEFATALTVRKPKWGVWAIVLAFMIAFSRLYLFMHYPTDVFVSIVLGVINGILGVVLCDLAYKIIEKRRANDPAKNG